MGVKDAGRRGMEERMASRGGRQTPSSQKKRRTAWVAESLDEPTGQGWKDRHR